jgi:2-oxoglutarate dehydrogenase E2 component (dihydrolipoamide succinyltransferase)
MHLILKNVAIKSLEIVALPALRRNFHFSYVGLKQIVELVPALGESITEGSIAKWAKSVGDKVAVDDVVVIVETDKVTVDIKSTNAGILLKQLAAESDTVW